MSKDKKMTFEEAYAAAEKHMETVDLSKFHAAQSSTKPQVPAAGQSEPTPAPQLNQAQLCANYMMVKPILVMVSYFPFFPAKWRDGVSFFVKAMDANCPLPQ